MNSIEHFIFFPQDTVSVPEFIWAIFQSPITTTLFPRVLLWMPEPAQPTRDSLKVPLN